MVDLPLNLVQASLWLPKGYRYTDFEGDIKEVARFSRAPPTADKEDTSAGEVGGQRNQARFRRTSISVCCLGTYSGGGSLCSDNTVGGALGGVDSVWALG